MELFAEMGRRLEAAWRAEDYAPARFPALAAEAIVESEALAAVDGPGLLSWVARADALPHQVDPTSRFGDLALTLFEAPRSPSPRSSGSTAAPRSISTASPAPSR